MDVVGLSSSTCLCDIVWILVAITPEWQGSVSNLEKGATEGVVQLSIITLLSLAGKVFSGGAGEEGPIEC